jgi:hypothetical protein
MLQSVNTVREVRMYENRHISREYYKQIRDFFITTRRKMQPIILTLF